ncbi:hypothetical protein Q5752_003667 [Cryptotrichosporon argae]
MSSISRSLSPARPVPSSSTTKTYSRRRALQQKRKAEYELDSDEDVDGGDGSPKRTRVIVPSRKRSVSSHLTSSPLSSVPSTPRARPSPSKSASSPSISGPVVNVQPASSDPPLPSSAPSTPPRPSRRLPAGQSPFATSPRDLSALFASPRRYDDDDEGESQETTVSDGGLRAGGSGGGSGSWGASSGGSGSGGSGGRPRPRRRMLTKAQSMADVPTGQRPASPLGRPATPSKLARTHSMPSTPSTGGRFGVSLGAASTGAGSQEAADGMRDAGLAGAATGSPRTTRTYGRSRSFLAQPADAATHRESYAELRKKYEVDAGLDGEGSGNLVDQLMLARAPEPISDMRSKGENRRFMDEVAYLVDGIESSTSHALKLTSAIDVLRNMEDETWVEKLRVCGQTERVFEVLLAARADEKDEIGNAIVLVFLATLLRAEGGSIYTVLRGHGKDVIELCLDALDVRNGPLDKAFKGKVTAAIQQLRSLASQSDDGDKENIATTRLASRIIAKFAELYSSPLVPTLASARPSARLLSAAISAIKPIRARLDWFQKGLPLIPDDVDVDLEYLDNTLSALSKVLTVSQSEREGLDKHARDAHGMIDMIMILTEMTMVEKPADDDTDSARQALQSALQVLATLADVSPTWATAIVQVPGAVTATGRVIIEREALGSRGKGSGGKDEGKPENLDDDDGHKDNDFAGDLLCVALALLASLLKGDEGAADIIATTRIASCSCPACLRTCTCKGAASISAHLTHIFRVYQEHDEEDLAPYLTGYLAFLLSLLVVGSPAAADDIVSGLPGHSRTECLEALYTTLSELDGIDTLARSKLRRLERGDGEDDHEGGDVSDEGETENVLAAATKALRDIDREAVLSIPLYTYPQAPARLFFPKATLLATLSRNKSMSKPAASPAPVSAPAASPAAAPSPAPSAPSSAWSRGPPAASANASPLPSTLPSASSTPPPQPNGSDGAQLAAGSGPGPVAIGHARKGSLLVAGGGVDFKRGPLAFGTVDQPNPLLSSSPAAPSITGTHLEDSVKSFGSIDASNESNPNIVRPPRRVSGPGSAAGPANGAPSAAASPAAPPAKKLDVHSLFGGKPQAQHNGPVAGISPPPPHIPGQPPTHDRRQSMNQGPYPVNGLPASSPHPYQQMSMPGQPGFRPPQGMPNQPRPPAGYPGQVPQVQQGFRVPQQGMQNGSVVRPGAPQGVPQPMPQRPMMMGQQMSGYGMQGQYPMMNPSYGYYPGYNPYEQYGGVPPQWAPQQHAPSMPMSPRNSQSQLAAPAQPSPVPPNATLPGSAGASPMPTPPSRPQSLVAGHQATASTSAIPSLAPGTPNRPVSIQAPVFTPGAQLNPAASAFSTPRARTALKISRPDGTQLDLSQAATAASVKTPGSAPASGAATPETPAEEPPKKKVPALPIVVRMESEDAKAKRLAEEAQKQKIKEQEDKEEQERKERQAARKAKEEAEQKAKDEAEHKAKDEAEQAAKAEAERRKVEEQLALEDEARKKQHQAEHAVAEAAKATANDTAKAEAEAAAAAAHEARAKADEVERRDLLTPAPSTAPSPLASPALAAAGLPAKPIGANGLRRATPSALDLRNAASRSPSVDNAPSALGSAKPIDDLAAIRYPTSVNPPSPSLNANAEPGKFRYDRDFLMQFMDVCKEKPETLPNLEEIGLEADPTSGFGQRGSSRGGSRSSMSGSSRTTGLGIVGNGRFPSMGAFDFGNSSLRTSSLRGTTSEQRMQASASRMGAGSMARTPSSGAGLPPMGLSASRGGANRSQRGVKRMPADSRGSFVDPDVAPLAVTANAWVNARSAGSDEKSPAFVERKVKALLNKLTEEKFASISQQILDWANKSKDETDGMTLKLVIKLVFEKATDEAHWSAMYAKLCRMLLEKLDPEISEVIEGKEHKGGSLFRKYLLGRCQQDFENGWKAREEAALAAQAKSEEDKAKMAEAEKGKADAEAAGTEAPETAEPLMLSDEYYAAQKIKRRGLGLVQLIGELYKLQMLSSPVLRRCLTKLLANADDPDEEDVESAIKLLTTIGYIFEREGKDALNIFFTRLYAIKDMDNVASRIKFMILDLIDLRKNGWVSRKGAAPTTIAEVHAQANKEAQERAQHAAASARDSMSRGNSRAGHARRDGPGPGEWQTAATARAPTRPADLSALGRGVSAAASSGASFRPEGVFGRNKKGGAGASATPPLSRQASTSNMNMFSALNEATGEAPAERRPSADAAAAADAPQRRRLNLAPRTKPLPGQEEAAGEGEGEGDEVEEGDEEDAEGEAEAEVGDAVDETEVKRKIDNDVLELWGEKGQGGTRSSSDIVEFYRAVPAGFKHVLSARLIEHIFTRNKAKDVEIVLGGWNGALAGGLASKEELRKGLEPRFRTLAGDAEDFPLAYDAMAALVRGIELDADAIAALIGSTEIIDDEDDFTPAKRLDKALEKYDKQKAAAAAAA